MIKLSVPETSALIDRCDNIAIKYYYGTLIDPNNQSFQFLYKFFSKLSDNLREEFK